MSNPGRAMADIRMLEELADGDTALHRVHPLAHLLTTLGFAVAAASYGKYALSAMVPLAFYPLTVFALAEIPPGAVFRRMLPALPLLLGIGLMNPLFDRQVVAVVAGVAVSAGWVSFLSIALRGCLTVVSALLLVCVTGFGGVAFSLRALGLPRVLVMQLEMTFRYIHVLGEEAGRMTTAHRLRAPGQKGVAWRHWGSFTGQWLLRTLRRADRLHHAMLCRGYVGEWPRPQARPPRPRDIAYAAGWLALFAAARLIDLPAALGTALLAIGG